MTWSTLPAYSDGNALTAAQVTAIKDNINETAPAKATTEGYWFIAGSSANTINQRAILESSILTQESSTRTTYGNLATTGPTVTITTGSQAIVSITAQMFQAGGDNIYMSYAVSGATTAASSDTRSLAFQAGANDAIRATATTLHSLTGGSNVFKAEYKNSAATSGTWDDRLVLVMAL